LRKFEDTKGVIKSPKNNRTDNTMAKRKTKRTEEYTMIYTEN
jgi:hypothetical protein